MALTASQVKTELDEVAGIIASARKTFSGCRSQIAAQLAKLQNIPTKYTDLITTTSNYGTSDAFEALSKAEVAKLQAEYVVLRDIFILAAADLDGYSV